MQVYSSRIVHAQKHIFFWHTSPIYFYILFTFYLQVCFLTIYQMKLMFSFILVMCRCIFILILVVDPGEGPGGPGPPLFFDQNEARRAEKIFLRDRPPLISGSGWPPPPPTLSEGLDPPLIFHIKVFVLVNFRDVANAFYLKIDESSYSTKT